MEEETRTPLTTDGYVDQLLVMLNVSTMSDAIHRVREMMEARPLVWLDAGNQIKLAQGVSVGAWFQVITAIQNKPG